MTVTATAHLLGLVILGAAALAFPATLVTWRDVMWGGFVGVSGGRRQERPEEAERYVVCHDFRAK